MTWQNKIIKKSTAATLFFFSFLFFLFFLFFPLFFLFFFSPLFLSLTRSLSFCPYSSPDLFLSTTNLGTVSSNTMDGKVRSKVDCFLGQRYSFDGGQWTELGAGTRLLLLPGLLGLAPDSFSYLDELGLVRSKTKLREVRSRPWQCISDLHHLNLDVAAIFCW